ncbi:hypothetical protein BJ138DRAFT_1175581 [Hygrophoropsis aurantiaca]|uniref:Uncharacterized protein n=1 Tax=Hygrophoropsis aurantiaca TaxID=72124 RepID=A0ACB8AU24_9AGAM|nr:hypothetical protein BJ138DRAFT_1175581 [Hygrophoropsis aurantiaca]
MGFLSILRITVFVVATLFAIVILPCSVLCQNKAAIAASCLTLISIPTIYILDRTRYGRITSMMVLEGVVAYLNSIAWLISAVIAALVIRSNLNRSESHVDGIDPLRFDRVICAFSFIVWFSLCMYSTALAIYALVAAGHGHCVWRLSVKQISKMIHPEINQTASAPKTHNRGHSIPYPTSTLPQYVDSGRYPISLTTHISAKPKETTHLPNAGPSNCWPSHGNYVGSLDRYLLAMIIDLENHPRGKINLDREYSRKRKRIKRRWQGFPKFGATKSETQKDIGSCLTLAEDKIAPNFERSEAPSIGSTTGCSTKTCSHFGS